MLLRPFPILACSSKLQCALSKEDIEANHMLRAAELADKSAGLTAPHPNAGCVLAHGARVVGEAYLYAQGTTSAEVQAVERAGEHARGATAYLNLEPGDCHGDESAVKALKLACLRIVWVLVFNSLRAHCGVCTINATCSHCKKNYRELRARRRWIEQTSFYYLSEIFFPTLI
ncbi:hypothetical protein O6H91_Y545700 [Diphasiastrum complanatum]|nr:hypothetical protein O6H91_Y545700 [Diphasiastrum complanatum]